MATEPKTLEDLILALGKEAPRMDDAAERIILANPELVVAGPDGRPVYLMGRFAAIAIMDFLCRAYGRPDLGYRPRRRLN